MKITFNNHYNNNDKNKQKSTEIDIEDCTITNYDPNNRNQSRRGDMKLTVQNGKFEYCKGGSPSKDSAVTMNSKKYSVFTAIAAMSTNDAGNKLTLDDLASARAKCDNEGKPTDKTLINLGITKILYDPNAGIATIMIGDNELLRIDFETESEKEAKNNSKTNEDEFKNRALEGGMSKKQFESAQKYIKDNFSGYEIINVRRDPNAKVATLVIANKDGVEFNIKYKDGKLVEDIAKFRGLANKGGMTDEQVSEAYDSIKTLYKNCTITSVRQDPNAKVVTFVLSNKKEVKYINGLLQTNKSSATSKLSSETAILNKIVSELKKVNQSQSDDLTIEDFLYARDNLKWRDWGLQAFRIDPSKGKITFILDNGVTIRKELKIDKSNEITYNSDTNSGKKDTIAFLNALGGQETRGCKNPYTKINYAGYVGRYQMGEQAMIEMGVYSKEPDGYRNGRPYYNNDWSGVFIKNKYNITNLWEYRNHPKKQETLQVDYKKREWKYIKNLKLDKYIGKTINGQVITASGLLAGAHLVGVGGLKKYLEGDYTVADGSGTKVSFYIEKFAGYSVSDITD